MKHWIYNILLCGCLVVIGVGIYEILITKQEYHQATREYENIQTTVKKKQKIKFDGLEKINPDVVAWIEIPGTKINYPIVQGKDNEEYLHKTFSGKVNHSGCIFLDIKCKKDFSSDNNILYGHHMKDGSMFAELVKFRDPSFEKKHREIILYLPTEMKRLKVVSAYAAQPEKIPVMFKNIQERQAYENKIQKRSNIESRKIKGKIYTFVTCSYEKEDNRTYVHAVEK